MKKPFNFEAYYDLIRERWLQGVRVNQISEEIGCDPRSLRRVARRLGLEKQWSVAAVRDMATSMLRKDEHPDKVVDALRQSGVCARMIFRIVKEAKAAVSEEREMSAFSTVEPDTTGLVRLAPGNYADPRSAELIMAARMK